MWRLESKQYNTMNTIQYNTIQYNTIHSSYAMVSSGRQEPLRECVYEENASDKWHVLRYLMRKHCITNSSYVSGEKRKCQKMWETTHFTSISNNLILISKVWNTSKKWSEIKDLPSNAIYSNEKKVQQYEKYKLLFSSYTWLYQTNKKTFDSKNWAVFSFLVPCLSRNLLVCLPVRTYVQPLAGK